MSNIIHQDVKHDKLTCMEWPSAFKTKYVWVRLINTFRWHSVFTMSYHGFLNQAKHEVLYTVLLNLDMVMVHTGANWRGNLPLLHGLLVSVKNMGFLYASYHRHNNTYLSLGKRVMEFWLEWEKPDVHRGSLIMWPKHFRQVLYYLS